MKGKLSLFWILIFLCFSPMKLFSQKDLILSPKGGAEISNNMPQFTWKKIDCKYYEIWIDNIKMDSISGRLNNYTPFPLSYGTHTWRLIAVLESGINTSEASFKITGKTLSILPENVILLRENWKVISFQQYGGFGKMITTENVNTNDWATTSIPSTVLTALVRNGKYPNPYVGMNNMKIPDSNDEYNKDYDLLKYSHIKGKNPWAKPYWFRKEFELKDIPENKLIWLNFNEINYRAEVWLNGQKLADSASMVGMERRFKFDVSPFVKKGKNVLAVLIYPLDFTGKPAIEPLQPFSDPGTNMADGMTGKNYSKWDVLGWDWQPAIRDRDMGITEEVYISFSDPLELSNLYISSDMNLPDTSNAIVNVSFDLINYSRIPQEGILKAVFEIGNERIPVEQAFRMGPEDTLRINWGPANQKGLILQHPKLWWPVGYGAQNLYNFILEASTSKGLKASTSSTLGIRKIETYIGPKERVYKINGKEIYLKGGNWVIDMLLNWDAKRYENEILLTRNANLNILRVWGPTGVPPQAFYDAADKYGILIWQDFLNDFWGTFKNTPGYQPEIKLYEKATTEIVCRYRNHPSLIMWCGGNEGVNPRENLIRDILAKYDNRSSRHYLKQSDGDGLHGGGPYRTHYPKEYFSHFKLNGFSSEIGSCGIPVFESIEKFMPQLGKNWMDGRFPIDGVWAYHDANNWPEPTDTRKFTFFDNIIRDSYKAPATTDLAGYQDYVAKCQLVNYDVNRAAIEAVNNQLWGNSSGVIVWKSNSSWPSMVWQIYDWYLQAHAGYYGLKKAAEPIHIQLNRDKNTISVWNSLYKNISRAHCSAVIYNTNLDTVWKVDDVKDLKANSVTQLSWQAPVKDELVFLVLQVKDNKGNLLSENKYWLNEKEDFSGLNKLGAAELDIKAIASQNVNQKTVKVTIKNVGKNIAFMVCVALKGKESDSEVLPVLWDNNYIILLPGESKTISATLTNEDIFEPLKLSCKAFNMKEPINVGISESIKK